MLVILLFNMTTTIPQHPLMVDELKIQILQENGPDQLVDKTTPIPVLKTTEEAVKTTEEALASIKTTAADLFLASFSPQRQRPVNRFVYHHFLSGL